MEPTANHRSDSRLLCRHFFPNVEKQTSKTERRKEKTWTSVIPRRTTSPGFGSGSGSIGQTKRICCPRRRISPSKNGIASRILLSSELARAAASARRYSAEDCGMVAAVLGVSAEYAVCDESRRPASSTRSAGRSSAAGKAARRVALRRVTSSSRAREAASSRLRPCDMTDTSDVSRVKLIS